MRKWVTFFSQTGSEIYNLSQKLDRYPDIIVTNREISNGINKSLLKTLPINTQFIAIPNKPTLEDYHSIIPDNSIVTLHGWLRIVPAEICEKYEIYNLHPANLLLHPHLKGKDPQKRAVAELQKWSGNTIHRCTAELDGGEIIATSKVLIENMFEFEAIHEIHKDATELWFNFLKEKLS